ncbi:MAG: GNAT family N-acetyltransferase [Ruminococcus sp.]|nr:GNAT family N-acetyltransferase [Ruminococcus sp.]
MSHTATKPFETPRLICRPFNMKDCEDMLRNWIADEDIQSEYGEPVYTTLPEVEKLVREYISKYNNPDFYRWAIIEKDSGECIGQIAFCRVYPDCNTAEIEYCIGKSFWGRGYAGEALQAVINYTFSQTDFTKLEAYHRIENTKSGRVLEKSAMKITDNVERFRRENELPHGEVCYCIEREK